MKLLDDPLIRSHFGIYLCHFPHPRMGHNNPCELNKPATALAVLEAMQAPIKEGEKILLLDERCSWVEDTWEVGQPALNSYHPYRLRLSDEFQTRPDEVGSIKFISHGDEHFIGADELRELVSLVKRLGKNS